MFPDECGKSNHERPRGDNTMIDGKMLRDAIISGANNMANHKADVDELNVFPVPDGDTGTNMSMTMSAAAADLKALPDNCTVEEASKVAAAAMLRGARGNSGVITSLLFRGFSKGLAGKTEANTADVGAAFENGVNSAYKAVMKPTEGTMLTVARVTGEKLVDAKPRDRKAMWKLIMKTAEETLATTPDLLPVLKKAGVVDAGGQGLVYIFEGMKSVMLEGVILKNGSDVQTAKPKVSTANVGKGVFAQELNPDITNAYCTEFLVNKNKGADGLKLRAFLESNGDSVVVVDDDEVIKAHVHTADPGVILSKALEFGYLSNLKIENMHEQYEARQAQGAGLERQAEEEKRETQHAFPYAAVNKDRAFGFVAVVAGEGLRDVFRDLGADAIVSGGQTMNPSTDDILSAVQSVPAKTVFVLPNNKNIIMAAEQSVKLADREVVVVPTRTVPQGMSAMLAFDPAADGQKNAIDMNNAAMKVDTGLITFAARNSEFDGKKIRRGEILAMDNGKLVSVGADVTKMTYRLARSMVKKNTSFVTLISGSDVDEADANTTLELLRTKIPQNIEVTLIKGGQPVYYYMISVE